MLANVNNGSGKNTANCYESAVKTLNSLQSNSDYIKSAIAKQRKHTNSTSLRDTTKYLLRSGITLEQLDTLSVIHIAGTKGKGSTCAFIESILREHGYRTGFYSSPHLVNLRERFQINGRSISKTKFANYFWKIYNILETQKEYADDQPKYFQFLTIMMFHLFLEANLDVAIIEVGVGGEFDCTNVIRNPVCTGITSLGLDHVPFLGDTIEKIAYQKSGIFKADSPAFTIHQIPEAMEVLKKCALEKQCELTVVPSLKDYPWYDEKLKLGIQSDVQFYNASLAIQLSNCWIKRNKMNESSDLFTFLSMDKVCKAITSCQWPGRTQILHGHMADFYLDGAHTWQSLHNCVTWFERQTQNRKGRKYLLFNLTGQRDSVELITLLKRVKFHKSYFLPNVAGYIKSADQKNFMNPVYEQLEKCRNNKDIWGEDGEVAKNVGEAFGMIAKHESKSEEKPIILITGSLHLVGAALLILDPDLTMKTDF